MYFITGDTVYKSGEKYYSKSGDTYTLKVAGTDYTVGDTIPANSVYEKLLYNRMYISTTETGQKYRFPYKPNGINDTLPEHEAGQNDVDLDAYTNTQGKTIRNRVRHDVKTRDFTVTEMNGEEMKRLMELRDPEWFWVTFFDEAEWDFVTKKMYCSSPKYHIYYADEDNPLLNMYTNISFGFVEE